MPRTAWTLASDMAQAYRSAALPPLGPRSSPVARQKLRVPWSTIRRMAVDQGGTITRGFLFADLRGYTDFVEQRGAAAAAELLTQYRALAREAIGQFGGAEIKTEGDSFYVVFDSVSSAVRCGLAITAAHRPDRPADSASVSASMRARRSRPTAGTSGHPSTSPRGSAPRQAPARSWSARPSALSRRPCSRSGSSREAGVS